jgi:hypothetical protein
MDFTVDRQVYTKSTRESKKPQHPMRPETRMHMMAYAGQETQRNFSSAQQVEEISSTILLRQSRISGSVWPQPPPTRCTKCCVCRVEEHTTRFAKLERMVLMPTY